MSRRKEKKAERQEAWENASPVARTVATVISAIIIVTIGIAIINFGGSASQKPRETELDKAKAKVAKICNRHKYEWNPILQKGNSEYEFCWY